MVVDFYPGPKSTRGRLDFAVQRVLDNHLDVVDEPPRVKLSSSKRNSRILFLGKREKDEIRGTLTIEELEVQLEVPFTLRRRGEITDPPYIEKEVRLQNGPDTRGGTLLVPPGKGPHPAVILIPALEQRKAEMSREDFRFYGDLFARGGVAVLLYDQRGFVSRPAEQGPMALEARTGDALAALELLARRPEIDAARIGLWGFELGGIVAPMAAARSKGVAFVIAVSSPGVPYSELPVHALGERLRGMGFSYGDVNDARAAFRRVLEYDRQGGDAEAMRRFLDQTRKARWAPYAQLPERVWRPRLGLLKCCDQYLDPAQFWEQVDVPVLLVYGTRDHLFAARESADRIEAALARRGNKDVTIKLYDRADHRMQHAWWFPSEMKDWLVKKMKVAPAVSRRPTARRARDSGAA